MSTSGASGFKEDFHCLMSTTGVTDVLQLIDSVARPLPVVLESLQPGASLMNVVLVRSYDIRLCRITLQ